MPQLLQLSRSRKEDIRRKAIELLAPWVDERVRKRLVEILHSDRALAGDACRAVLRQGSAIVAPLSEILRQPARGREFGYASFALAKLEGTRNRDLLTADMVPHLLRELRGQDRFIRATAAIALGVLAHRTDASFESGGHDKKIVDNLLTVVAPDEFIESLALIKPMAIEVIVKFTGRNFHAKRSGWIGWWEASRGTFVGLRRTLDVTPSNVGRALLMWNAGVHFIAFRGPDVPDAQVPEGATAFYLGSESMTKLIQGLRDLGFMASTQLPKIPDVWTLDLRVDGARVLQRVAASTDPSSRGTRIHRAIAEVARTEVWQRHRDPERHPDPAAFWRSEQKRFAGDPAKRRARLVQLIVDRIGKLDRAGRKDALDDLQSVPGLPKLITEIQGADLVKVARAQSKLDPSDFRLLEIALLAPGETVWRQALQVLDGRDAGGAFATRLFKLLGPDRVLVAIQHPSPAIAIAAMHDAAANRHRESVNALLGRLRDRDGQVQRTAIYALGRLHAVEARGALLEYEKTAHPVIRREIWAALGRIGGRRVPAILKRAMLLPAVADRLAALSAMGYTQSPELARFLAARFVTHGSGDTELAKRAERSLRQMGALLAIPSLRQHLQMQEGPAREQLILLLADLQDATVVSDLIDLLRHPQHERIAAEYLAEITGIDLSADNNRSRSMRIWFASNRNVGQGKWFLDALARARFATTLVPDQLSPRSGVGPVRELSRIMLAAKVRHLKVMAATLLRETTGVDFVRGVRHAEGAALQAIADRYRIHAATARAAAK